MFGYISCDENKLTVQERDIVGAFYCGLCMALKKNFGNTARIFTNLDCTYAYMLVTSVLDTTIDIASQRCFLHPFTKRHIAYVDDELSKRISSATILISYYKLLDDCKDEKRSLTKKSMRGFYKKVYKKAKENLPEFDSILNNLLKETQKLESEGKDALFHLMDISGDILSAMTKACGADALSDLFFHLGRYVYFVDALDDYEGDIKKKRYNAFVYKLGNFKTKKALLLNKNDEVNAIFDEIYQSINSVYNELKPKDDPNTIFENLFTDGLKASYKYAKKVD